MSVDQGIIWMEISGTTVHVRGVEVYHGTQNKPCEDSSGRDGLVGLITRLKMVVVWSMALESVFKWNPSALSNGRAMPSLLQSAAVDA